MDVSLLSYTTIYSEVKMASVRKLPKLGGKRKVGDDDEEDKENFFMCSPFKQLKLSPITKQDSGSHVLLSNSAGQLKLSVYINYGLLTIHVMEGRQFSSKWKTTCSSYVKMSLVPDDCKRTRCKTSIIQDTNNPMFDERFSFELLDSDCDKRLLISVWHRDEDRKCSEFLGCMSFGVRNLMSTTRNVNGWYYLLTEEVGRKKHLQSLGGGMVTSNSRPKLSERSKNIPEVNVDLKAMDSLTLVIKRGRQGYGFSLTGASPAYVARVDEGSHAQHSGLQKGDNIVRINGQNVSRSTSESVAKIIKNSMKQIILDIQRSVISNKSDSLSQVSSDSLPYHTSCQVHGHSDLVTRGHHDLLNRSDERKQQDKLSSSSSSSQHSCPPERARAILQLTDCEERYISLMQYGIQRYSRPLRHRVMTSQEHLDVFQNVEKLVALSEYHYRHLKEKNNSGSRRNVLVGRIYLSKVAILCEAYEIFSSGYPHAVQILSQLRGYNELEGFLQESTLEAGQPTISSFIERPSQHLNDLLRHLHILLSWTPSEHPDYANLSHVAQAVQLSCSRIAQNQAAQAPRLTHWSGSCASLGSQSTGSVPSSAGQNQSLSRYSISSNTSVDAEVLDLQQRLIWSSRVQKFTVAAPSRHIIFAGELSRVDIQEGSMLWVILLSDLLLITRVELNGQYTVIDDPIYVEDIAEHNFACEHETDFTLSVEPHVDESFDSWDMRSFTFRAPSVEQKFVWKSIMEQRLSSIQSSGDPLLVPYGAGDSLENFGVL